MIVTRRTVILGGSAAALGVSVTTMLSGWPLSRGVRPAGAVMVQDHTLAPARNFAGVVRAAGGQVLDSGDSVDALAGKLLRRPALLVAGITPYAEASALAAALVPSGYEQAFELQGNGVCCVAGTGDSRWLPVNRAIVAAGPLWPEAFARWAIAPDQAVAPATHPRQQAAGSAAPGDMVTGWVLMHETYSPI